MKHCKRSEVPAEYRRPPFKVRLGQIALQVLVTFLSIAIGTIIFCFT